jgi:hypothetical protein
VTRLLTPRTARQYSADFRAFQSWCAVQGYEALPAEAAVVHMFVQHEVRRGLALPTIGRVLAAIRHAHLAAGYTPPTQDGRARAALHEAVDARHTCAGRFKLRSFADALPARQ